MPRPSLSSLAVSIFLLASASAPPTDAGEASAGTGATTPEVGTPTSPTEGAPSQPGGRFPGDTAPQNLEGTPAAPSRSAYSGVRVRIPDVRGELRISGYFQLWFMISEQAENGRNEPVTGDAAAAESSGFQFRRARLNLDLDFEEGLVALRTGLRLEGSPGLLDAYAAVRPLGKRLELLAGQMKVPSSYEVDVQPTETDFPSMSLFSERVTDWSLSRTTAQVSPFSGARSYFRDLGLAVKAEGWGASGFLMVGNGLGANQYVGASENKQFVFANSFGSYFFGIRLGFDPMPLLAGSLPAGFPVRSVRLGGHASWNRHPNLLMNDEKTVVDLMRRSWSLDLQIDVLGRARLTGMMGAGYILDDADWDGKTDYAYRGWEAKAMAVIVPEWLEAGIRYDVYWDEQRESGDDEYRYAFTLGATFTWKPHLKVQFEYKQKILDSASDPDLRDDVYLLAIQAAF